MLLEKPQGMSNPCQPTKLHTNPYKPLGREVHASPTDCITRKSRSTVLSAARASSTTGIYKNQLHRVSCGEITLGSCCTDRSRLLLLRHESLVFVCLTWLCIEQLTAKQLVLRHCVPEFQTALPQIGPALNIGLSQSRPEIISRHSHVTSRNHIRNPPVQPVQQD